MSLLFKAAQRNDLAGVHQELELDASYLTPCEFARALHVAIYNDCVAVVQYLWPMQFVRPLDQDQTQEKDNVALHYQACQSGSTRVMATVPATKPAVLHAGLSTACLHGHTNAVRRLISNKAAVKPKALGATPMYHAISCGSARIVLLLLRANALLNASVSCSFAGKTPLALAQSLCPTFSTLDSTTSTCRKLVRRKLVERLLARASTRVNARQ